MEINPKPTLTLSYNYLNDEGRNTTIEEVACLDIFVFNPAGYYIKTLHAGHEELTASKGLLLLEGVPAGEYTVVTYANARQSVYAPMTAGVSTVTDLYLTLGSRAFYSTCDPLFHHLGTYRVQRGEPVITPVTLDKLYYRVDLNVTGADALDDFRITFSGAPSGIDYAGKPVTGSVIYQPVLLPAETGGQNGSLFLPRFPDKQNVMMLFACGQRQLGHMTLSEYLRENDVLIDFSAKDVIIPINVKINSSNILVTVNNWDEGTMQIPIVGH